MVSFIGDMWKVAVKIKHYYEDSEDISDIMLLQKYVGGKYSYLILRHFDEIDKNIVLFDIDQLTNMSKVCEYYEYTFNVNCKYFFTKDIFDSKLYTGMIVN